MHRPVQQLFFSKAAIARRGNAGLSQEILIYLRCFETSLVISNMLTWLLPLNTGLSWSSALIMIFFFLSCRPRLLMYAQSFFVSSGRDSGCEPTTAASLSSGWTGFMKAGFGLRLEVFLVFGMDAD